MIKYPGAFLDHGPFKINLGNPICGFISRYLWLLQPETAY
jgi:hypothetical protein